MIAIVLSLIIVFVIIAIVVIRSERKPRKKPLILLDPEAKKLQIKEKIDEQQENNQENGVPDDLIVCKMLPDSDGNCPLSFLEQDDEGCCTKITPPSDIDMITDIYPQMALDILQMLGELVFEILVGEVFEAIVISAPVYLAASNALRRAAFKTIKTVGRSAARVAASKATQVFAKALLKALTKVVTSTTFRAFGSALTAAAIADLLLSVFDPSGFSAFIPNSASKATRDQIYVNLMLTIPKDSYPPAFSAAVAFPDVFKIAMTSYMSDLMPEVMKRLNNDYKDVIVNAMEKAEDDDTSSPFEDPVVMSLITQSMNYVLESDPVKRDTFIYNKMISIFTEMGGEGTNDIELHTELSTSFRYGVTITESMVEKWNNKHWETWKEYNYTKSSGEPPPMVAIYTDKYMYINEDDPGKYVFDPNLIEKTLPRKVALIYPLGQVVQHCEATDRYATYMGFATNENVKVNPYDYGVRFNHKTGTCKYTPEYCARMGLDYQSGGITDCDYYEGQKVAEMIFGESLTRYSIIGANETAEGFKKFFGIK